MTTPPGEVLPPSNTACAYSPHLEDLLDDPAIQGVIVTCETNRHAEMVLAAARAGKHILCQKPMALSLDDCDRMAAAVAQAGVTFMMAFQMRHDPSNRKIKELLEQGAVGKVGLLRRRHCIPVLFDERFVTGPSRWHIDPEKNMGMFMDDASHATDFIHWLLGRPESVMAEIGNTLTTVAPDDTGVAIYRFASGAMAVLVNSSVTLAGENTTEVYGDQGVIIQNHDDVPSTNSAAAPSHRAQALHAHPAGMGGSGHRHPVQPRRTHRRCPARLRRLPAPGTRPAHHGCRRPRFRRDGAGRVSFGARGAPGSLSIVIQLRCASARTRNHMTGV